MTRRLVVMVFFSCCLLAPHLAASSGICILEPVSVTHIEGQVHFVSENGVVGSIAEGVRIHLKRRGEDGNLILVAETVTNSQGIFRLHDLRKGSYDLSLSCPVATLGVQVNVVSSAGLFRRSSANWIEIGLGLVQPKGCPPSFVKAVRKNDRINPQLAKAGTRPTPGVNPTASQSGRRVTLKSLDDDLESAELP